MNAITSILYKSISSKLKSIIIIRQSSAQSHMEIFSEKLKSARNVVFLTGSGISEESGLPTFTGSGSVWRNFTSLTLTYPPAFQETPSIFWEFYNYRRELAAKAQPNDAHIAIANYELKYGQEKNITVITQNIDSMHSRAGSINLIELHGNLFKTRCTACDAVAVNIERPICPALKNTGSPDVNATEAEISTEQLPRCEGCGSLLRPHVIWFGESVEQALKDQADLAISSCDMCLVVSTPSLVSPAATYPAEAAARGASVAEFNAEPPPPQQLYDFYFEGPVARSIPYALEN